ncbi:C40 family peptidase [Paenarthrobacter sp. NPDC089675]|uniref:C40 family peptidase n=1 Tax=Paenarthrobacter sp. NPDC089675 TaxID=3364376 RepID=UPI00380CE173
MVEALGRIQGIQASLQQLAERSVSSAAASVSTASSVTPADSSASFASALNTALGTSGVPDLSTVLSAVGSTTPVQAPAATGNTGGGTTGDAVVAAAKKYIGVPYVWGGTNPAVGMDCSGFVQRVFKDLGVELPRVVSDQMQKGTPVASLAEAKPGDLLVSYGGEHISIYLGNGKAIDAPVPGQTIQIRDAWEKYSNLTSIRRIVPAGGA